MDEVLPRYTLTFYCGMRYEQQKYWTACIQKSDSSKQCSPTFRITNLSLLSISEAQFNSLLHRPLFIKSTGRFFDNATSETRGHRFITEGWLTLAGTKPDIFQLT